ncbi:MAG: ribonuclease P protein component [Micropruina sp.]|nr:MAG: ribonuclease P protein component [Micropruina sp.]
MLPASARLRTAEDFRQTVRLGVRVGRPSMVLHLRRTDTPPSRAGFVVSKAVGNAVTRNRTKRVLRHLAAARLGEAPFAVDMVVRALPRERPDLAGDFASAWEASLQRLSAA